MAAYGSTGCKLFIGGTGTLGSEASWVEVGEIENMGEFGDQSEIVRFLSLSDGRVRKSRGTKDAGDLTVTFAYDYENAGQDALRTAADLTTNVKYNFKVELNDAPSGASPKPTRFTFKAIPQGYRINIGGANGTVTASCSLAIDTAITTQDASPT